MGRLSTTSVGLALLLAFGAATTAQEASPEPEVSPTPEQLAEAEERLATASCLGQPATIVAIEGFETIGTAGADVIVGTAGDDDIRGEGGNDRICAGPGADLVEGGAGNDRVDGGLGDDQLDGGAGNDTINGGKGADLVTGAAGNDRLVGSAGDDTLDGGKGNDVCVGGKGQDWLPGCNDKRGTKGKLVIRKNTTLKGPHRGSIVIEASKVTLDCGGHTVLGPGGGVGISVEASRSRVTIRNCAVTNFRLGISLDWLNRGNTLTRNYVYRNGQGGIDVARGINNKLTWNIVDDNALGGSGWTYGFNVGGGRGNVLKHNRARGNGSGNGFNYTVDGSRVTFSHNTSTGGDFGFSIRGNRQTIHGNTATGATYFGFGEFHNFASNSVFSDNVVTGTLGEAAFRMGGFGNTVTGNVVRDNTARGMEDISVPGANSYADNICINNLGGNSQPEGLCHATPPAEPGPSDDPGASGAPTAEE